MTIVNRGFIYHVHKNLVCTRSAVLAQKVLVSRLNMLEGRADKQDHVLDLDEDPQVVKLLLHYLYNLEYPTLRIDLDHDHGFVVKDYQGSMSEDWASLNTGAMTPGTTDAGGCNGCVSSQACPHDHADGVSDECRTKEISKGQEDFQGGRGDQWLVC